MRQDTFDFLAPIPLYRERSKDNLLPALALPTISFVKASFSSDGSRTEKIKSLIDLAAFGNGLFLRGIQPIQRFMTPAAAAQS